MENDTCKCENKRICENGKYFASSMDDLVLTYNEIIDVKETNFNKRT